jgi:hypothetical protein
MKAEFYHQLGSLLFLPIAALLLFVGLFTVIVVRTLARRAAFYEPLARLALEEKEGEDA